MKNAIILSCSTGQGHNSCAAAIKEYFENNGVSCDIADSLSFASPGFSKFMSWGHSFVYKHIPGLFSWGYSFSERRRGVLKKGSLMYWLVTGGTERMYHRLRDGEYDTVICTHVFSALALTRLLERHELDAATAYVATDYTCSPGTGSMELDMFFVPSVSLIGEFDSRVASPHRTAATGIPVRSGFMSRGGREEARRALHIGENNRHLLIMCGSMGCGPIVRLLRQVTRDLPEDLEVTVICGRNESLRRKLSRGYASFKRVHIVGYTEDVPLYMDSADLYLTKPGGVSVTEAAAKELPMAFIDPVAGCEKYNMDFFTSMGAAIADGSAESLAERVVRLLSSEEELMRMRKALAKYRQPDGAKLIYRELCKGARQ